MQKVLKKLCGRQPAIVNFVLMFFSLYMFFSSISSILTYIQGPVPLENNNNLAEFCGEYVSTSFQHAIQKYPVVDTSIQDISVSVAEQYGYLVVSDDDGKTNVFSIIVPADKQAEMDLRLVGAEILADNIHENRKVIGTIEELSEEQRFLLKAVLSSEAYADTQVQLFAINTETIEVERKEKVLRKIIFILGACAAIVAIHVGTRFGFEKQFQAHKLKYNESELEKDFKIAHKITSNLYVGKRFTFYVHNQKIEILDTRKCIWAYCQNNSRNPFSVNIVFWLMDGTRLTLRLNKNVWKKYLTQLCSMQPHIVLGYSKEKEKVFRRDRQEFYDKFKEHSMAMAQEMLEEEQEDEQHQENE